MGETENVSRKEKKRGALMQEHPDVLVERLPVLLRPDPSRVLLRPMDLSPAGRAGDLVNRVLELSQRQAGEVLQHVRHQFAHRHPDPEAFWWQRFRELQEKGLVPGSPSPVQQLLIGAYFSMEYSVEAAALFNPSLVFLDETGDGSIRFVLSLRAVGEGHLSSLVFREGVLDARGSLQVHPPVPWYQGPRIYPIAPDSASVNYRAEFDPETPLSGRVLFPVVPQEQNGIEDARFVRFQEEDGSVWFYATYVAYDGRHLAQHLLQTRDFCRFQVQALQGPGVQNKGMALFPRKIDGQYVMLSRPDNERLFVLTSPDLHYWEPGRLVLEPQEAWELVQLGNCGSPLETEAGWLVITHGVGPVRRYCLGAVLLDVREPHRVLARLPQPLLAPDESEREGYVPNVVYSCGGQMAGEWLYLPYAMSDSATSFLRIHVPALLEAMV